VTVDSAGLRGRVTSTDVFCGVLVTAVLVRLLFGDLFATPAVAAWSTVFVAICVQAAPYLVLGVLLSTAIAVFVPPSFFARVLPDRPSLAVPVAGLAGAALPGCECGSVPVAASLIRRGVAPGPAVAFLLSAPAINPVVLVATAVAFPGRPEMVVARLVASLATALTVGWLWQRLGRDLPIRAGARLPDGASVWQRAELTASHDLAQALGMLTIGAASAAFLNVTVPRSWLDHLAGNEIAGIIALALLAVVLAVCSEADAFIAASLTQFSLTARLAFMVVGPAVDVKLIAMQVGTFGRGFAVRFAPLALTVAAGAAAAVGTVLL
jgi:uncharacterized membrane protein YraQ (UPF0718 family)